MNGVMWLGCFGMWERLTIFFHDSFQGVVFFAIILFGLVVLMALVG